MYVGIHPIKHKVKYKQYLFFSIIIIDVFRKIESRLHESLSPFKGREWVGARGEQSTSQPIGAPASSCASVREEAGKARWGLGRGFGRQAGPSGLELTGVSRACGHLSTNDQSGGVGRPCWHWHRGVCRRGPTGRRTSLACSRPSPKCPAVPQPWQRAPREAGWPLSLMESSQLPVRRVLLPLFSR